VYGTIEEPFAALPIRSQFSSDEWPSLWGLKDAHRVVSRETIAVHVISYGLVMTIAAKTGVYCAGLACKLVFFVWAMFFPLPRFLFTPGLCVVPLHLKLLGYNCWCLLWGRGELQGASCMNLKNSGQLSRVYISMFEFGDMPSRPGCPNMSFYLMEYFTLTLNYIQHLGRVRYEPT
jgi:hypothetical protein